MDNNVKNAMLSLYPKRNFPVPSDPETDEEPERQEFIHPVMLKNKNVENTMGKKWFFSAIIAGISVFLFSSFFLDVIDDICMRRDTTVFNASGDPKISLVVVIFTIILLITRTFFSLI
jgi:hypothetical protein